jgi:hypothetical protein
LDSTIAQKILERSLEHSHTSYRFPEKHPACGFTLVVDGHFKTHYDSETAAQEAGAELFGRSPILPGPDLRCCDQDAVAAAIDSLPMFGMGNS